MEEEDYSHLHEINYSEDYNRSYDTIYIAEIQHLGLRTYRVLKDKDDMILDNKIEAQFEKWDQQWARTDAKIKKATEKYFGSQHADEVTKEAKLNLYRTENILKYTLDVDDTVDWNALKDRKVFSVTNPKASILIQKGKIQHPVKPELSSLPEMPSSANYQPTLSFFDKLIKSSREKKQQQAEYFFNAAVKQWKVKVKEVEDNNQVIEQAHQRSIESYEKKIQSIEKKAQKAEDEWNNEMDAFYEKQNAYNDNIDHLEKLYLSKDPVSVIEYCELVLNNSEYFDLFSKDFDLEYNPETKLLIVEYVLPAPDALPRLTELKYITTKSEFKESFMPDSQYEKLYDTTVYNITLRTIHELFEADKADALYTIVFNGWVNAINKATGNNVNSCIVSLQTHKDEFMAIDLSRVDPKLCFKNLKGVSGSKLAGIPAIKPLLQLNKEDKRFVASYEVSSQLDEGFNLAAMKWEDFEHLIRELFEKEFSSDGGEVKVTRASKDGGVDAVAFDPDPIRGGKIVIQAKRYTNTVGVSAVRDLYGTVLNEGANKGILVTTADYGPDSIEFAKNKPITLISGSNLLFLLEKHGQKARIDLAEAKYLNERR
ncbi:restriction endonuclease [Siphonobacter sp. SORGH_AS_1065]|uniref:restriction endonuclease n=1 Tax=Siphonobacter sp. SORGH_AS_1065 TaxID=3041795 RepID=UPI00278567E6|nr:restriction endonuclease [Siphonobacter sp. SORGH_AS_1065]MDQ1089031.1 restriction system protein [Siphonobacter sp. SORGH_AS_1065]